MGRDATPGQDRSGERRFYVGMSLLVLIAVLVGFAPTFYLVPFRGKPDFLLPYTALVIFHGFLFSSWVLLQMVQPLLITTGRTRIHRRLGIAGVCLAASMVLIGWLTAVHAAARGSAPPGIDPKTFLAIPWFDMVVFPILIGAGFATRKTPQAHKRWMLLASVSILPAAIARWPLPMAQSGPLGFFGISDLFLLPLIGWDIVSTGRIQRATWIGALVILASQLLRLAISQTTIWQSFATMLVELVNR
jgi:hypothetical protein